MAAFIVILSIFFGIIFIKDRIIELIKFKEYMKEMSVKEANEEIKSERTIRQKGTIFIFFFLAILSFIFMSQSKTEQKTKIETKVEEKKEVVEKKEKTEGKTADKKAEEEETKKKVVKEKARILELLETLKEEHMNLWNKTIEAFNNGNFEKAYGYSKKSSEQISKVLEKIDSYKCVETYNPAFDLNCDGLLDSAFEAYTMKDNFHLALKDFMENGMTEQNLQVIQTNFQGAGEDWNKLTKEIREFKNIEYYK